MSEALSRIRHAAFELERLEEALGWLERELEDITPGADPEKKAGNRTTDNFSFKPHCGGTPGANEARKELEEMIAKQWPIMLCAAIADVRTKINVQKGIMRDWANEL